MQEFNLVRGSYTTAHFDLIAAQIGRVCMHIPN
jgi:hypothetical protein